METLDYISQSSYGNYSKLKRFLNSVGKTTDPNKKSIINMAERNGTFELFKPKDVKTFFKIYNECSNDKSNKLHIQESPRTQAYSGIYLDFDPKYKVVPQIGSMEYRNLITVCLQVLTTIVDIKKLDTVVFLTECESPTLVNDIYKSGFHLVFPGICMNVGAKEEYLKLLALNDALSKQFIVKWECVNTMEQIVDQNLSSTQVCLFGSSKIDSDPYRLKSIYKVTIQDDIIQVDKNKINYEFLAWEMSILFENEIERHIFNSKYDKKVKLVEVDVSIESKLSTLKVHYPESIYILKLIDNIDDEVFSDMKSWNIFVSAIGNINPYFIDLAIYGSMKCSEKFNKPQTHKLLEFSFNKGINNESKWGIGKLCNWVKENKGSDVLFSLRDNDLVNKMYSYAYDSGGAYSDTKYSDVLQTILGDKYKVSYNPTKKNDSFWYKMKNKGPDAFKWHMYPKTGDPYHLFQEIPIILSPLMDQVRDSLRERKHIETKENGKYIEKMLSSIKTAKNTIENMPKKRTIVSDLRTRLMDEDFYYKLDKQIDIIGINGGVLKLPSFDSNVNPNDESTWNRCEAIYEMNDYNVSLNTKRDYIEYDENDVNIKEVYSVLQDGFYIDEKEDVNNDGYDKESLDYVLFHYAVGLDRRQKLIPILNLWGGGGNLKSTLASLVQNTIGGDLLVPVKMDFLSDESGPVNAPSPITMKMVGKNYVNFQEGGEGKVLNEAKLKWLLSPGEEKTARDLYGSSVQFFLHAVLTCYTNYNLVVDSPNHAIWRRMLFLHMVATFVQYPKLPWERKNNTYYIEKWTTENRIKNAFFSILCHYNEIITNKYGGDITNVPCVRIKKQTQDYRNKQDIIESFIMKRMEKDEDSTVQLDDVVSAFIMWYKKTDGTVPQYPKAIREKFKSSKLTTLDGENGDYIKGYSLIDLM